MKPVSGRFKRRWGLWITLGLLLLAIGIPTLQFVRDVQQNQRDRALIAAIKKHDVVAVKTRLEQGADANARESAEPPHSLWQHVKELFYKRLKTRPAGLSALSLTEENFDTEIASLLLSKGADVNTKDSEGKTPLVYVIDRVSNKYEFGGDNPIPPYSSFQSYVRLLVKSGADVNAVNYLGQPRLNRMALIGDAELARLLLEKGAKVNQEDQNGETPLMTAISNERAEMVRVLLEAHADVSRKYSDGHTALSFAKEKYSSNMEPMTSRKIIRMLREAGAKQ